MTALAFRIDAINPQHVHVTVLAGPGGASARARAGQLSLTHDEWDDLRRILQRGDTESQIEFGRLELGYVTG